MLLSENIDIRKIFHYCKHAQCIDTLHRHVINSLCNNIVNCCIKTIL